MYACVCQVWLTCDDLGLSKDHLLRDATLSLVQLLANAGNDAQTGLQSVGCLLTNQLSPWKKQNNHDAHSAYLHHLGTCCSTCTCVTLISVTVGTETSESRLNYLIALPKDVAPLRVAQDHPVHTTVFDHRRAADEMITGGITATIENTHFARVGNVRGPSRWCLTTADLNLFSFPARPAYLISPVKAPLAVL